MNRTDWLQNKRRSSEERMDTLFAPIYDDHWGATIAPTHRQFIGKFLDLCPPQGLILDAACGTGKYWPLILDSGRQVIGTDQSQGMLARAAARFPGVPAEKVGLQELAYHETFDAAICMDAMEFIPPEDWPLVLHNLHRALKPQGSLYLTVEIASEAEIGEAFVAGQALGLPVVYGESAHEPGYHYYPSLEQVKEWLKQAHFRLLEETVGDEYWHVLLQKQLVPEANK